MKTPEENKILGERIKEFRASKGLTQKDVSVMSKIHQARISSLELGRDKARDDEIRGLKAVGVNLDFMKPPQSLNMNSHIFSDNPLISLNLVDLQPKTTNSRWSGRIVLDVLDRNVHGNLEAVMTIPLKYKQAEALAHALLNAIDACESRKINIWGA